MRILPINSFEANSWVINGLLFSFSFFLLSFATSDRGNVPALSEREKSYCGIGSESIKLIVNGRNVADHL